MFLQGDQSVVLVVNDKQHVVLMWSTEYHISATMDVYLFYISTRKIEGENAIFTILRFFLHCYYINNITSFATFTF